MTSHSRVTLPAPVTPEKRIEVAVPEPKCTSGVGTDE